MAFDEGLPIPRDSTQFVGQSTAQHGKGSTAVPTQIGSDSVPTAVQATKTAGRALQDRLMRSHVSLMFSPDTEIIQVAALSSLGHEKRHQCQWCGAPQRFFVLLGLGLGSRGPDTTSNGTRHVMSFI